MLLPTRCPVCVQFVDGWCRRCWATVPPAPLHSPVPAALGFSGDGRRFVLALKYANARTLAAPIAARLAVLVVGDHDVVTWAPTNRSRRRRRGYDQGELVALELGRQLGLPVRGLLRRRDRIHQTGRSRSERVRRPPRFVARRARVPCRVLLVDDVVTTGATLLAARRALERAGYVEVDCVAAAATP